MSSSSYSPPPILSSKDDAVVLQTCQAHGLTPDEFSALRSRSSAAKATSYCVYSRFRVGATLLASDGALISGANVENASFPVGTCAERVAFGKAVTDQAFAAEGRDGGKGGRRGFRAVAVATDISPPASPCGMCRQFIREFCELSTPIIMFDKNEDFVVMTLGQLLPVSFGPDRLPPPGAPGTM